MLGIQLVFISLFGVAGILLRYFASVSLTSPVTFVNLLGGFLVGIVYGVGKENPQWVSPTVSTALVVGLLGGFTTFSAFSLEVMKLLETGKWTTAGFQLFVFPAITVIFCYFGSQVPKMI